MDNTRMSICEKVRLTRMKAAEHDERFEYRPTAVDCMAGITEECLKNYETGKTPPTPEVITIMADAYNAPELMTWYCSHTCPIGKRKGVCANTVKDVPNLVMQLYHSPDRSVEILNKIVSIFEDGELTADELSEVDKVIEMLTIRRNTDDNAISILKKQKAELLNHQPQKIEKRGEGVA